MSNGKDMIIHSIVGLIKNESMLYKLYRNFERNVKIELDLSIDATNLELKEATGIDTSNFALKSYLASLKTEVDKIDVEKLKTVPVGLSKLSSVVKNEVVEKTV